MSHSFYAASFLQGPDPTKLSDPTAAPVSEQPSRPAIDLPPAGTPFQMALYDVCDPEAEPICRSRVFAPTDENRRYVAEVIRLYNKSVAKQRDKQHCLGIFPAMESASPAIAAPASKPAAKPAKPSAYAPGSAAKQNRANERKAKRKSDKKFVASYERRLAHGKQFVSKAETERYAACG